MDDSNSKKMQKVLLKKKSSEKKRLDDSETELKSKKKKLKKKSSEKNRQAMIKISKTFEKICEVLEKISLLNDYDLPCFYQRQAMIKISKTFEKICEVLEKIQQILLTHGDSLTEKETPKKEKEFECCFSVPEAQGYNWSNNSQAILVKGLDSSLPRDVIKSLLIELFVSCGEVTRVFVPIECKTGAPLGYAFVNMKEEYDTKKALALNGSDLGGRKLEVMMARDKVEYTSYPYPNFKGCGICRYRNFMTNLTNTHAETSGGRIFSREVFLGGAIKK